MSGNEHESVFWRFYAFSTPADGRVVQNWFDALTDEERDELTDTLAYLQHLPINRWAYPRFEHLGEGISEVRAKVPGRHLWIRVYGIFFPKKQRFSYTFLLGVLKKEKNDTHGKREAERHRRLLEAGEANIHEFEFSREPDRSASQGKAKTIPIR